MIIDFDESYTDLANMDSYTRAWYWSSTLESLRKLYSIDREYKDFAKYLNDEWGIVFIIRNGGIFGVDIKDSCLTGLLLKFPSPVDRGIRRSARIN